MALRTAVTPAVPTCAPTSCTPVSAVTSVFLTRFRIPTEMISPPLMAVRIASSIRVVASTVSGCDRDRLAGMVSSLPMSMRCSDRCGKRATDLAEQGGGGDAGADERPVAARERHGAQEPAQRGHEGGGELERE